VKVNELIELLTNMPADYDVLRAGDLFNLHEIVSVDKNDDEKYVEVV
jgi:hypothetical protein